MQKRDDAKRKCMILLRPQYKQLLENLARCENTSNSEVAARAFEAYAKLQGVQF